MQHYGPTTIYSGHCPACTGEEQHEPWCPCLPSNQPTTGGVYWVPRGAPEVVIRYGWICARCNVSHAPDVKTCTCATGMKESQNEPIRSF